MRGLWANCGEEGGGLGGQIQDGEGKVAVGRGTARRQVAVEAVYGEEDTTEASCHAMV